MTRATTPLTLDTPLKRDEKAIAALDKRVKRVDEDRWISSRYAPAEARASLTVLYALAFELARVRTVVSEDMLGQIRFQWWRDALDEIDANKTPRAHDVALALGVEIGLGALKSDALRKLIDGYEAAFLAEDRAQEPEAWLASIGANILAPTHGWGKQLQQVAPAFAATRRGDTKAFGEVVAAAPADIRPAIAHFRMRKLYIGDKRPGPIRKRLCVLRGVQTGRV